MRRDHLVLVVVSILVAFGGLLLIENDRYLESSINWNESIIDEIYGILTR